MVTAFMNTPISIRLINCESKGLEKIWIKSIEDKIATTLHGKARSTATVINRTFSGYMPNASVTTNTAGRKYAPLIIAASFDFGRFIRRSNLTPAISRRADNRIRAESRA